MIKVNGNLFRTVMAFVSVEETRYYLNGVSVEPHEGGGALLVATDGHRLICVHDTDAICEKAAIIKLPPTMLTALVPDKVKSTEEDDWGDDETVLVEDKARILIIESNGHATIEGVVRSAGSVFIDGKYPEWRKIVGPFAQSGGPFQAFNAGYMSAFAKMARLLGDQTCRVMFVPGEKADQAALILFPGTDRAFGLLMPTRIGDSKAPALPAFFQLQKVAA